MQRRLGSDSIDEVDDGLALAQLDVDFLACDFVDYERWNVPERVSFQGDPGLRLCRDLVVLQVFVLQAECDCPCERREWGADQCIRRICHRYPDVGQVRRKSGCEKSLQLSLTYKYVSSGITQPVDCSVRKEAWTAIGTHVEPLSAELHWAVAGCSKMKRA